MNFSIRLVICAALAVALTSCDNGPPKPLDITRDQFIADFNQAINSHSSRLPHLANSGWSDVDSDGYTKSNVGRKCVATLRMDSSKNLINSASVRIDVRKPENAADYAECFLILLESFDKDLGKDRGKGAVDLFSTLVREVSQTKNGLTETTKGPYHYSLSMLASPEWKMVDLWIAKAP